MYMDNHDNSYLSVWYGNDFGIYSLLVEFPKWQIFDSVGSDLAFFHIKQKNCTILAITQLSYNPTSEMLEIDCFQVVFLLKQR